MTTTFRDATKALKSAGYVEIRCKGDHHFYKHPLTGKCCTVVGKSSGSTISPGVVKAIERATGLTIHR